MCIPVLDHSHFPESHISTLVRVAVNLTHGHLDTYVELTHLRKSQVDTTQVDTRINSTHGHLDTTRHTLNNLTARQFSDAE